MASVPKYSDFKPSKDITSLSGATGARDRCFAKPTESAMQSRSRTDEADDHGCTRHRQSGELKLQIPGEAHVRKQRLVDVNST